MRACASCLRRARLLGELTPDLDRPALRLPLFATHDVEQQAAAVRGAGRRRPAALDRSDDELLTDAERDERELAVEAVCVHAPGYPRRLEDLDDPPAVLHVLGGIERLEAVLGPDLGRASVAVVGARRAPADARRVARRLGEAASQAGIAVVSGMAFGIDAAAHEGALAPGPAAGPSGVGGTVAVLAGGPERPSPARMRQLHERIARDGVVVSELPPGVSPRRWSFPARNRIIAALGDALVVVSCARGSGSLRSVQHAFALGRPIGAVPGPVLDPAYAGSNDLLRGGPLWDDDLDAARAIVEPDDVRPLIRGDLLQPLAVRAQREGTEVRRDVPLPDGPIASVDLLTGLDGEARALAARLLAGPRTIESLIAESDATAVLAGLGALEADGRLRRGLAGDLELVTAPPCSGLPAGDRDRPHPARPEDDPTGGGR